ncbi:putative mitochondrial F1F0 ATP synthase subunit Atp18 [Bisporella sp. PMI_857]|nr:putative mitochondrial F1F0 ATP synthase subunit Atp18 [Bisporella sp. PMI_857]
MSLFGKKFPAPVAKPMAPFYIAGLVILYGVNAAQNALMNSEEFKNDPRNPRVKSGKAAAADKH